jgi:hypothetical protein
MSTGLQKRFIHLLYTWSALPNVDRITEEVHSARNIREAQLRKGGIVRR